ncbi:MAG TPA: glycine cleavage T C-terminal barrel domain-containing protein [Thermoleophilaceae bacterium]|nr:glycine cleavage T C-terminal barrel domain-containing protein [Thermoleophilaceae bacterium]
MIASAEYELLTEQAGLVARPGRAVLELTGSEAAEFLQGQVSNDVEALEPGQGCYATLLDHKGKLRTDLRVLRLAADRLLVDAEAIGRRPLAHNFETYSLGRDVKSRDASDDHVVLSLVGPRAHELLADPPAREEHACNEGELGVQVTTDVGVDLIVPAGGEADVRAALDVPGADEQAAEVVRVERGRPRLGLDMDASTMPQEAGINERAVSFTKGCYVGQETVARLHYKGKPNRHMRGLRLSAPAQHGDPIVLGEKQVGTIGSVAESPTHGQIALALVRREAEPGTEVTVAGAPAEVVELPFG